MEIYQVGGSVRDRLLRIKSRDLDYVVVGATAAQLLAKGYKQVGADFPVFLHPKTKCEHALARTERKRGSGHRGFALDASPEVTLEEDLGRRDLTVNAMALAGDGRLIDPFGGRADLAKRKLRHVSAAFAEDPLRVLRAARLAAQLQFVVDEGTMRLMATMVKEGALAELSVERVWMELVRGLETNIPSFMFEVLRQCGALAELLPEIDALFAVPQDAACHPEGDVGTHTLRVVNACASNWWNTEVRWAALVHDVGKGLTAPKDLPYHPGHEEAGVALARAINRRLKVPRSFARVAEAATRLHGAIHAFDGLDAAAVVALFEELAVWRDPSLFRQVLALAETDYESSPKVAVIYEPHPQRKLIERCLAAALELKVDPELVKDAADPAKVVRELRVRQIAKVL